MGRKDFMSKYTNLVNVINNNETIIKGFICKPEMIVLGNGMADIAIVTRIELQKSYGNWEIYAIWAYEYNGEWTPRYLKIRDIFDTGDGDISRELFIELENMSVARLEKWLDADWDVPCPRGIRIWE